jgi:HD-like signal output (HDOD) protein
VEVLDRDELLIQAQELAPLPPTATRLAALVANPNSDIRAIVEAISLDSALTVKLLRLANSAASGPVSEIATVDQAVIRIGTGGVLSMAVAAGVRGRMTTKVEGYGLEEGELWEHSVGAALAAESLSGLCSVEVPPESFTAALLHDVGKLVLARFLAPQLEEFMHRRQLEGASSSEAAERELLAIDHAELGGVIARHWKLPKSIGVGIQYHHTPSECTDVEGGPVVAWVVHLANLVANSLGCGGELRVPVDGDFEPALERLGMDPTALEKLMYRTQLRIDQVGERFS